MKWTLKTPRFGDIVRVEAGQFYHYGIYAGDDEIIQFGPTPDARHSLLDRDIRVCTSDVNGFLKGGFLEVASLSLPERIKAAPPKEVVGRARSRIGEGGYDVLTNNCEHFVNACVFGVKSSEQVDSVRAFWKNLPVLDVYVAAQPASLNVTTVVPEERQAQLDQTNHPAVRAQRFFAWQVLCAGMNRSLGLDASRIGLNRSENGKWRSDACEISLSHCDGAAAAAVSKKPVGVDIEPAESPRYREKLLDRIATEREREWVEGLGTVGIVKLWTRKEASFKRRDRKTFSPIEEDAQSDLIRTYLITLDRDYVVSVSAESFANIRIYLVDASLHAHRISEPGEL